MFVTVLMAAILAQVPVPAVGGGDRPPALQPAGSRYQAELRTTAELRKARQAAGARARAARREVERGEWEAQARARDAAAAHSADAALKAAQAQALRGLSDAARRLAAAAEAFYRLDSQRAGAPQLFVPGEGFVPYPYGVAPPAWYLPRPPRPLWATPVPAPAPTPPAATAAGAQAS
jgi:hypothetical protein